MGCASSHLLNPEDDFTSALGHHIVSLTSTTYGLLTLDPPSEPPPEVINSWELMAGLDSTIESFRFYPQTSKPLPRGNTLVDQENLDPMWVRPVASKTLFIDEFEELCPPKGENKVVMYTTSLRGVRKTYEACNVVRGVMEGYGVLVCERDISMDEGFREELRELMKGKDRSELVPPRVFVKGRYVGGADEVVRTMEKGCLGELLQGLPKSKAGYVCHGCGGVRFLPCFTCNGSCKMVMGSEEKRVKMVVVQCGDCNENGLVRCPICSC